MDVEEVVPERHLAVSLLEGARASEGMLECERCPYATTRFARMQRHLRSHKKKDTKHACEVCGKMLGCKATLEGHLRLHSGDLFHCEVCGKAYNYTGRLKLHVQLKHSSQPVERVKKFQCDTCRSKFISETGLVEHMKRHTEGKKFKCERCGEKFYTRYLLMEHLRVIHTGECPFVCDKCGERFNRSYNLRYHTKRSLCNMRRGKPKVQTSPRRSTRLSSSTYARTSYESLYDSS